MKTTSLTAPSNAAAATVTATVRGTSLSIDFNVLEPTGVDHADFVQYWPYTSTTLAGAGVHLRPYVGPTSVSFNKVQILEVGQNASGISGYFDSHTPPNHDSAHGANAWINLGCDNSWQGDYDWAKSYDWAAPWSGQGFSGGSYTWQIPFAWRVGNGTAHTNETGWSQEHTLSPNGTMTVSKFGHTVSRTIQNVYSGQ